MLGVYDEALVQYDELDALFTQFVLNSNVGGKVDSLLCLENKISVFEFSEHTCSKFMLCADTPEWLSSFQCSFDNWPGLVLGQTVNQTQRSLLKECKASLLEFRSYLFSRQCAMLLLTFKPWEVRMLNGTSKEFVWLHDWKILNE